MTENLTRRDRWEAAIKQARKLADGTKIKVRQNVYECCRGCIGHEKLGFKTEQELENASYAFTYGGQGFRTSWSFDGQTMEYPAKGSYRWSPTVDSVTFNHGDPDGFEGRAAQSIVDAFRANGFYVEWDGSMARCVEVFPHRELVDLVKHASERTFTFADFATV